MPKGLPDTPIPRWRIELNAQDGVMTKFDVFMYTDDIKKWYLCDEMANMLREMTACYSGDIDQLKRIHGLLARYEDIIKAQELDREKRAES